MSGLSEIILTQVYNNYTPDTASLRYGGPIPVLLYGNSAKHDVFDSFLRSLGLVVYDDFASRNPAVNTETKFVGLNSYGMKRPLPYGSYLVDSPSFKGLTAKQVRGRLLTVSLKGLMKLDRYYMNEFRCNRKAVPVESTYSNHSWAFTYIFNERTFDDDAPFELKSMPTLKIGDKEIFTFG